MRLNRLIKSVKTKTNSNFLSYVVVMALSIAVYEMVLAGLLIVKGFKYKASTVVRKFQTALQTTVAQISGFNIG